MGWDGELVGSFVERFFVKFGSSFWDEFGTIWNVVKDRCIFGGFGTDYLGICLICLLLLDLYLALVREFYLISMMILIFIVFNEKY